ncbi:MAG TPA: hypothetical protein VLJ41_08230 [Segetibacter sp.]|nr:hypothetical protein [Segetibacter sp.]
MNKPFEVCLPSVLPLSQVRNLEKVYGKRGLNPPKGGCPFNIGGQNN